jgi:hypothetical protein
VRIALGAVAENKRGKRETVNVEPVQQLNRRPEMTAPLAYDLDAIAARLSVKRPLLVDSLCAHQWDGRPAVRVGDRRQEEAVRGVRHQTYAEEIIMPAAPKFSANVT